MPELDGVGTARRLRDDPLTRYVPVIALTSLGVGRASLPADVSFAAVLAKPVKHAELVATVAAAVRLPPSDATRRPELARAAS
jgi:CheY-like chemotaxis protein